jgi:hypothetical protein
MRILIATDAWRPQVNGVVRTLTSLARSASALGAEIEFLTPDGFPSLGVPTYPGLRMALPDRREIARRIKAAAPDALHIATEGPIGWTARAYCRRRKLAFTTSYTTRFPEYIAARSIIPAALSYAVLRHFHAAAAMTMVATPSLERELSARGFRKLGAWTRGVDTDLFRPDEVAELDLPRPIFMTVGRVAVEKNLEAFLSELAWIQSRDRRRTAEGRTGAALSEGQVFGRKNRPGFDLASGRGGRLCFPEPHRHLRRRSTRSAGVRYSRCRFPGYRPARCDCGSPDRRAGYGLAKRVYPRTRHISRVLPELCARAFVGKQRKAVHWQPDGVAAEPFAAACPASGGQQPGA